MTWPFKRKQETPAAVAPAPAPINVEAIASAAAAEASLATAQIMTETFRAIVATSPVGQAPMAVGNSPFNVYAYNRPMDFTTPQDPNRRPRQVISVDMLRSLADRYDILRACIQHLKREVAAVPIQIVSKDSKDDSDATKKRIKEAEAFFGMGGGLGGPGKMRGEFEGMCIEDLSVVGSAAIYYAPTLGGKPYEVFAIDAATIRPNVDGFGFPGPGQEVFEQWIYGTKVNGYTRDELNFMGLPTNARSYTPYYASPIEWLVMTVRSALKADEWNAAWLTDGNTPNTLIAAPESWTPTQMREYAEYFDALLAGDSKMRQKAKIVPAGTKAESQSRKDQDFKEFELWLLRRTCAIMGVQPASIGFAGEQYKVSQEDSMDSTSQFGAGVILDWRQAIYDDLLIRLGYDDLEARNVTDREEKATERATRNVALVGGGVKTINEARKDEGLDPIDGGDTLFVPGALRPLDQALAPPEPAPAPGGDPADTKKPAGGAPVKNGDQQRVELAQWQRKAENRIRQNKPAAAPFEALSLPVEITERVAGGLHDCKTVADVRTLFAEVAVKNREALDDWAQRLSDELKELAIA